MTEFEAFTAWREKLKLSKRDLAELTGYSYDAICLFERGVSSKKTWSSKKVVYPQAPVDPQVWKRFKLVCSGVERALKSKKEFDW
jgi:hypothetical protein